MECMFTLFKEGKTGKGTQRLGMKTIWIFKVFPFSQVVVHMHTDFESVPSILYYCKDCIYLLTYQFG